MKVVCDSIVKHLPASAAPPVTREQIQQEIVTGACPLVYQGDGSTYVHFSAVAPATGSLKVIVPPGEPVPYETGKTYSLAIS